MPRAILNENMLSTIILLLSHISPVIIKFIEISLFLGTYFFSEDNSSRDSASRDNSSEVSSSEGLFSRDFCEHILDRSIIYAACFMVIVSSGATTCFSCIFLFNGILSLYQQIFNASGVSYIHLLLYKLIVLQGL